MRSPALILLVSALILAGPVRAAEEGQEQGPAGGTTLSQPLPLTPAVPPSPPAEETPGFQAVRPVSTVVEMAPPPVVVPTAAVAPAPVPVVTSAPASTATPAPAPAPAQPAPSFGARELGLITAGLVAAVLLVLGAVIAGRIGAATAAAQARREEAARRQAMLAALVLELEARRQAFEAVPVPPNAEAGVSFVSAVLALADMDQGWRSAQASLHLLPEKQAGHLLVHYAAVRHVATFVKGLSLTAGLRMLQANRIGGHPCPDPAAMREAHVELAAAFRGVDKLVQGLRIAP